MKVINVSYPNINKIENLAACIGYFDGIHIAHQQLINETVELSRSLNCQSALITFNPDPWVVIKQKTDYQYLTNFSQRCKIIEQLGIENMIVIEFDQAFMNLSVDEFIDCLVQLGVKELICGFDFRFGKMAKGSVVDLIRSSKLHTHVIERIGDQNKFSSTLVTQLIEAGDVEQANQILGRPYQVIGKVIKGRQIGRTIGFPTANLGLDFPYVIPRHGVYTGTVLINNQIYQCLISVGSNPTVNASAGFLSIEVLIINFNQDIYGLEIAVDLLKFIRPEMKFSDKHALADQISLDLLELDSSKTD